MPNNLFHNKFSKELLSKLVNEANLVEIISADLNVKLKKKGLHYFMCCPFHVEKTPSFSIRNNMYYCFGCKASGNAITWLREFRNYSFFEAVIKLSEITQIQLPTNKNPDSNLSNILFDVLAYCNYLYKFKIKKEPKLYNFLLKERGLSSESIEKYNIGLVTAGISALVQKKYSSNLLMNLGIFIKNKNGELKDLLKYRITFPIFDEYNKIVSFSGRKLPNISNYPKYLNGHETSFFKKTEILYGLNFSKKYIKMTNTILIVEGYFDHIILSQNGQENSVATMGTSLTEFQLNKIFSLADNIIFCLDGDCAGIQSALRVAHMCLNILTDNKNVSFVLLPNNHDPDSYIREKGIENFNKEMGKKIFLSSFIIDNLITSNKYDHKSIESKVNIACKAKAIINSINVNAVFYKSAFKSSIESKIGIKIEG